MIKVRSGHEYSVSDFLPIVILLNDQDLSVLFTKPSYEKQYQKYLGCLWFSQLSQYYPTSVSLTQFLWWPSVSCRLVEFLLSTKCQWELAANWSLAAFLEVSRNLFSLHLGSFFFFFLLFFIICFLTLPKWKNGKGNSCSVQNLVEFSKFTVNSATDK